MRQRTKPRRYSLRVTRDAERLYIDLLKGCLTRSLFEDSDEIIGFSPWQRKPWKRQFSRVIGRAAGEFGLEVVRKRPYSAHAREHGLDWPARAETMAGLKRLDNVEECVRAVLRDGIPGDLMETGVWRGGTAIFMRGLLEVLGDDNRRVWAADSFAGLPPPNETEFGADRGDPHHTYSELAVSLEEVKRNFRRYGLLDERVEFLKGFFKDTLADAPVRRLAVLRLDGDMYESTMQALEPLYPKLSPGGFCIIDDYHAVAGCREAVLDFRSRCGIHEQMLEIDGSAIYWRRDRSPDSRR
jgi:O-methyltransferase